MARRPGPARPSPLSGKAPPRFTAPFAITWRQVFAVWLVGSLILVGASWRLAPKATVDAGHTAWHSSRVAWSYGLLYANRYWPGWMPLAVPRPHHWPGYNRQLPWPGDARRLPWPSPGPMAKPKPGRPTAPAHPGGHSDGPTQDPQGAAPHSSRPTGPEAPLDGRHAPLASGASGRQPSSKRSASEGRRPSSAAAPTQRAAARTFGGASGSNRPRRRER